MKTAGGRGRRRAAAGTGARRPGAQRPARAAAQGRAQTGATGDQNFLSVAKLFGARCVVQKPFTVEEIRRAVHRTLEH